MHKACVNSRWHLWAKLWGDTCWHQGWRDLGITQRAPGFSWRAAPRAWQDDDWFASASGFLLIISAFSTFLTRLPNLKLHHPLQRHTGASSPPSPLTDLIAAGWDAGIPGKPHWWEQPRSTKWEPTGQLRGAAFQGTSKTGRVLQLPSGFE